jgi:transcriptional regulator with XRE-family HTH domain
MEISKLLSDKAILAEIGDRVARQRLDQQLTQTAVAQEAGISKRTLERIEAGASVQLLSTIRVLRAIGLLSNLNLMIPELGPSPIEMLQLKGKERQRASSKKLNAPKKSWSWDDEI